MTFSNAVLTGACGGLGQALARALIASGCRVALIGLDGERLHALAALAPGRCAVYQPDVSDAAAMLAVAQDWMQRHGTPDLVIANAGVAGGFDTAQPQDLAVLARADADEHGGWPWGPCVNGACKCYWRLNLFGYSHIRRRTSEGDSSARMQCSPGRRPRRPRTTTITLSIRRDM